jgi:hypothetical protein
MFSHLKNPNNIKNLSIAVLNILFFIVVQYLFFTIVAAKQLNKVIENKIGLVNEYLALNDAEKILVSKNIHSPKNEQINNIAKKQENQRDSMNSQLFKQRILPLIIVLIIAVITLFYFVYQNRDNNDGGQIDFSYKLGIGLIAGAYVTELLFFFGIVRQYIFAGDHTLIDTLYNGIDKKLD